jgi:hypothetical protein
LEWAANPLGWALFHKGVKKGRKEAAAFGVFVFGFSAAAAAFAAACANSEKLV